MKPRLDRYLVNKGHFPSRQRAQEAIKAGLVRVNGQPALRPGAAINGDPQVEVIGELLPYASRGGLKLARALAIFGLSPVGRVCLDIGASTGGFTDCLLKNGARRVYAVDVGTGQLAAELRHDPRVVVLEGVNARYLSAEQVPEEVALAAIDVSFISVTKVLPAVAGRLAMRGDLVVLVKPQFEVGPDRVGRRGVVRDQALHREAILTVAEAAPALGLGAQGLDYSLLVGPKGNIEFLLWLEAGVPSRLTALDWARRVDEVVATAHSALGQRE
ncbi:MAG: TlyA family RNA methyltransferase [Bacillota bacterium]